MGPIGSAVLTFIGYKRTDKQTNRQAKFIYRLYIIHYTSCISRIHYLMNILQKTSIKDGRGDRGGEKCWRNPYVKGGEGGLGGILWKGGGKELE